MKRILVGDLARKKSLCLHRFALCRALCWRARVCAWKHKIEIEIILEEKKSEYSNIECDEDGRGWAGRKEIKIRAWLAFIACAHEEEDFSAR